MAEQFQNRKTYTEEQAANMGTPERTSAEDKAHKAELERKARSLFGSAPDNSLAPGDYD